MLLFNIRRSYDEDERNMGEVDCFIFRRVLKLMQYDLVENYSTNNTTGGEEENASFIY